MRARTTVLSVLALALLFLPIAARASKASYYVVIPKVLSYPTTTLTFSSRNLLFYSQPITPAGIRVQFDNANWSATVSDVHWLTKGSGTYITFTCQASSTACVQATGGKGFYKYSLMPSTAAAPSTSGKYALTWDVVPPGDLVFDNLVVTPEPNTGVLLGTGLLLLLGVAGLLRFLGMTRRRAVQQ